MSSDRKQREALFWGRITEAFWHPRRVLQRVENGMVDGMPDSLMVSDGVTNWVELKAPESEPARASTPLLVHKLLLSQRNWLLAHRQAGGRGWVAIETPLRVMLIPARHADSINSASVVQLIGMAVFSEPRPMKPGAWARMLAALQDRDYTP